MKITATTKLAVGVLTVGALALSGCASSDSDASGSGGDKQLKIGFFGYSKANTFAAGTYSGVEEYAKANDATVEFVDPNFDAQLQAQQITDAVTSKRYDVMIVQANDGNALVQPIKAAIAADITVVAEFTPIGPKFDTTESQVPGLINVVQAPVQNGKDLATMGLDACATLASDPCKVAYLQGSTTLPLEVARTKAAVSTLEVGGAEVVATPDSGYTAETGRGAMQDILQSNPDVDVVIGSSQTIGGASKLGGDDIKFVVNGSSRQSVAAVKDGTYYSIAILPEKASGAKAAELGLAAARGKDVADSYDYSSLTAVGATGTKETLGDFAGDYDD